MMQFNCLPGPAKVSSKGVSININAGDDIRVDDYRLYVDVPCRITIEPLPTPVDDEGYEIEGE